MNVLGQGTVYGSLAAEYMIPSLEGNVRILSGP
jgi:hypothetical protein